MEYTIDAQGKKLGRIASQAASILIGKNTTKYARNEFPNIKVKITNASRIDITNKKIAGKTYKSFSGYPGGLRMIAMKKMLADRGYKEIFRKTVYGMLPINKLRAQIIKNLIVEN